MWPAICKRLPVLCLLLLQLCVYGQGTGDPLFKKFEVATKCYDRKSYDSALQFFQVAINFAQKNNLDSDYITARCYYYSGLCYQERQQPLPAHNNFYKALQLGRQYHHTTEVSDAVIALNQLHWLITKKDWEFPYNPATTTIAELVLYQIEKVDSLSADSVLISIYGGRYDGIKEGVTGKVFSAYNQKTGRKSFVSLGDAKITRMTNNRTMAIVKTLDGKKILPNDIVYLKSEVPISVRHSTFRNLIVSDVYLINNYNEKNYERRYFFNYYDSLLDGEVLENLKKDVDEIVDVFGNDTTYLGYEAKDGIFKNEHVIPAMSKSTKEHLTLFLDFVNQFPGNYCGSNYKFSETYATWVFNNAPLIKQDITSYLEKRTNDSVCRWEMAKLLTQINEAHTADEWISGGIQAAYTENMRLARSYARLLNNEGLLLKKLSPGAWNKYILGICENKNGNDARADSLLHAALSEFKVAGDQEGEVWTISALTNFKKNKEVTLYVQGGHLMPYILALSANPRYFATAGNDDLIKIWDIYQGKEVKTIAAHKDEIRGLSFSKDGRYMVSTSIDSTVKVWNAYDYSLLKTIKMKVPQLVAVITPDCKRIATGGRDSVIQLLDLETGKVMNRLKKHKGKISDICFDPTDPTVMFTAGYDSMVYRWDLDSMKVNGWYKEKGKVLSVKMSPDSKYMTTLTSDTMINVWNYLTDDRWYSQRVSNNGGTFGSEDFSPDGKFLVYPIQGNLMKILDLEKRKYYTYYTDAFFPLESVHFSKDGNFLIEKYAPGGINKIMLFTGFDVDNPTDPSLKEMKLYTNPPVAVQFSQDDKKLFICSNNLTQLDLSTGKTTIVCKAAQIMTQDVCLVLNDETLAVTTEARKPVLHIHDTKADEDIKSLYLDSTIQKVSTFSFANKETRCYLGGSDGTIRAWDLANNKIIFTVSIPFSNDDHEVKILKVDSFRHCLYASTDYKTLFILDPDNGAIKDSIKGSGIIASKDFLYVATGYGELLKCDAATHKIIKRLRLSNEDFGLGMMLSPDMQKLVVQSTATSITVLDAKTDKTLYSFYDHDFGNAGMHISHDGKLLATGGFDNKVNLYDLQTGKKKIIIYTPADEEPVISDTQGHYMAPKKSLDGIVFNYNNNAYGFEQFDLQFNRPDIILKELNKADNSLIKTYYTAYQKRLQRSGLTEAQVNNEIHLPTTTLNDKYAIRPTTTLPDYELDISCYDSRYKLQSLHVLVNNNPVFGTKGKDVSAQNTSSINEKINVPLSTGNNQIKIYCVNEKGSSSLKETFEVLSSFVPKEKPQTLFIGIAVANYKDSSMSLRYSAKDIRDLAASFKKIYPDAIIDTLIDQKATKENILALRQQLLKTHVNDKVILAVTGHGLLSDSLDFYYGTYNVDFKKPELLGLKYEQLEGLLDDIPARQKLLLIDACHSGALDKETLLALKKEEKTKEKKQQSNPGVALYASRGGDVENKEAKLDAGSTFDLMQNQFADLTNSNGTVVISAAGGLEFAFESEKWNNGVFTYCIRKAIEETEADRTGGNLDGMVSVQELLNYVSTKVTELTDGNQRPTSRRENLEYDWRVR